MNLVYVGVGALVLYVILKKQKENSEKVSATGAYNTAKAGLNCPCRYGDKIVYIKCKKKNCIACCDSLVDFAHDEGWI